MVNWIKKNITNKLVIINRVFDQMIKKSGYTTHIKFNIKLLIVSLFVLILHAGLPSLGGFTFSLIFLFITLLLFFPIGLRQAKRGYSKVWAFEEKGTFFSLLGATWFRITLSFLLAIITATAFVVTLAEVSTNLVFTIFLFVPLYVYVHQIAANKFKPEIIFYPLNIINTSHLTSRLLCLLGFIIPLIINLNFGFETERSVIFNSSTLNEAVALAKLLEIFNDVALEVAADIFKSQELFILLKAIIFLKYVGFLWALFLLYELAYLPFDEHKKTVLHLKFFKSEKITSQIYQWKFIAFLVFGIIVFWIPTSANLENRLSNRPLSIQTEKIETSLNEFIEKLVELIDEQFYEPGTVKKIKLLEEKISQSYDSTDFNRAHNQALEDAFNRMEANTEVFLDNYYSMPAEYVRLSKMFQGELENYIRTSLETALMLDNPFNKLNEIQELEIIKIRNFDEDKSTAHKELKGLKESAKVAISDGETPKVVETYNTKFPKLVLGSTTLEKNIKLRAGAAAGAGAITSTTVALISKKLAAQGAYKGLSIAMTKVLGKKVAATAVGSVVGGFLGSVVPLAGTAGGIVTGGALAGFFVEWAGVNLDEFINRDNLRSQIYETLEAQKAKMKLN